ncbi:MAG: hypothetical protein L0H10_16625 [Comamonas sp.]|nr:MULTISPECIES: hypothetical protein [Comamonas]MDN5505420.1 hypothetical protein [Comamonas sp.]MDN5535919.1 hypothetical protein [Comamonas sp.]
MEINSPQLLRARYPSSSVQYSAAACTPHRAQGLHRRLEQALMLPDVLRQRLYTLRYSVKLATTICALARREASEDGERSCADWRRQRMTAVKAANALESPTPEENIHEEQNHKGLMDIEAQNGD